MLVPNVKRRRRRRKELTDKNLANSTARCEAQDVVPYPWVSAHEPQSGGELATIAWVEVHAEVLADTGMYEIGGEREVGEREKRA